MHRRAGYHEKILIAAAQPEWLAEVVDKLTFRLLAIDVSEKYKRALGALEAAELPHRPLEPNAIRG